MIRIVIAEDQELLLGIIGSLLNLEEDMEVVGQSGKMEEVLALAEELHPDICIMDMEFFEKKDMAEKLKALGSKMLVLTTFAEAGNIQRLVEADVRGYLLKDSSSEELTGSIRSIMDGKRVYSPALLEDDPENTTETEEGASLSPEDQLLNGSSVQQHTALETVRIYLTTVKDKMKLPAG